MRRHIFALTFVALPLAAALGTAQSRTSDVKGVEVDALDRKADPCVDFYQFACGGWVAGTHCPLIVRRTDASRRCRSTTSPFCAASSRRRAARATAQGRGLLRGVHRRVENRASGVAPIASDLLTIDELVNPDDLPGCSRGSTRLACRRCSASARKSTLGDPTQQIADIDQDGLSLPDREYYLKTDARSVKPPRHVRRDRRKDARAGRHPTRTGGRRCQGGALDRDRAGERGARSRQAP